MANGELGCRPILPLRLPAILTTITVAALGAVAASAAAIQDPPTPESWAVVVGALCIAAGRIPASSIRTGHHTGDYDLSDAAVVVALVLLPAPELVLVTALAVPAVHTLMRKSFVKVLFNGASVTVGVALAAAVVLAAGGVPGDLPGAHLLLTIPAGLAFCAWTTLSVTVVLSAVTGQPLRHTLRQALGRSTAMAAGNVALGCAVVALARWSPPTLVVLPPVLLGLVMVYRLHLASTRQRDSWRLLEAAARELADLDEGSVTARAHMLAKKIFEPDNVEITLDAADARGHGHAVTGHAAPGQPATATAQAAPAEANGPPTPGKTPGKNCPVPVHSDARDHHGIHHGVETAVVPHQHPPRSEARSRSRVRVRARPRVRDIDHPLVGPAGHIGVLRLTFTEPAPWTEHEHDVLAAFANLLALAVENARSYTEARHAASHDALTGLGNRRALFSRGARILASNTGTDTTVGLLLVDLDRFKEVNDTLGHSAGDRLLRGVADRLRSSVRSGDLVARIGGDEFAVVLRGLADADAAETVAGSLAKALARPIAVDGVSLAVEASIGLACFPTDGDTVSALLRHADIALYQAKQARCGHRRYRSADDPATLDHLALVADLHTALADGHVVLRFSPRLDLPSGTVSTVEALPHWDHARLGPLPRKRFLPAAGRSALAGALTRHVLDQALRACAQWRADGHRVRVGVRLFPRNLAEPDLARDVAWLLLRHRVPAEALAVCVPAVALAGEATACAQVGELRRLGLGVCLSGEGIWPTDGTVDWLTGAAGGLDEIELDADLIGDLAVAGPAVALARAVAGLAHELGLRVVARGVDEPAALDVVVALGCDGVHGRVVEQRADLGMGTGLGPGHHVGVGRDAGGNAGADRRVGVDGGVGVAGSGGVGVAGSDDVGVEPTRGMGREVGTEPYWGMEPPAVSALLRGPALPVARPTPVLALAGTRRERRR